MVTSTYSLQVQRVTVAPDHTDWHYIHTNTHTHTHKHIQTQTHTHIHTHTLKHTHHTHVRAPLDEGSERRKPDKTQNLQDRDIHAVSGIRTRHPCNRTAADSFLSGEAN